MGLNGVLAGDSIKVAVKWSLPDVVEAWNTLYWYRSDSETDTILWETMIGYLETKLGDLFVTLLASVHTTVNVTSFLLYTMVWDTGVWVTEGLGGEGDIDLDGLAAGEMAPHGVAALITYPTLYPGTRARHYLPGFADSAFLASTVTAGTQTVMGNFIDEYLETWEPVADRYFVPVVLSYKSATSRLLVKGKISDYCAYQRRRGPGRGV